METVAYFYRYLQKIVLSLECLRCLFYSSMVDRGCSYRPQFRLANFGTVGVLPERFSLTPETVGLWRRFNY